MTGLTDRYHTACRRPRLTDRSIFFYQSTVHP